MTITKEQYDKLARLMVLAEKNALADCAAQVFLDTKSGQIWFAQLGQNEHYPDNAHMVVIYAVKPWEDKLKDLYEDENSDVDWEDVAYKFTDEYEAFENWYFEDNVDGFKVFEILDEALERNGIEVEE